MLKEKLKEYYKNKDNIIIRFLNIANRHLEMKPLLTDFVREIVILSGCSAVGIRMLDFEGNIPYEAYEGFDDDFYSSESPLSIKTDKCMCINVIKGNIDPKLPFYTEKGSFYMNHTTKFLATVSEEDKGQTRNKCNQVGYESVALVPIVSSSNILGLIHLADPKEDMTSLDLVSTLEIIAMELAVAIRRVWMQQKLKESEEKYRMLFESSNDGIITTDSEGIIVSTNPAALAILGYNSPEGLITSSSIDLFVDPSQREQLIKKALEIGYLENTEVSLRKKDGSIIYCLLSGIFQRDNKDNLIRWEGFFKDITKLKKAEEELKTSEKRFQTVAENFPNGAIILYDHNLRYLLAEGEVIEKVGLTSEKKVGNNLKDIVTDEYYNALAPHYKAALNGERHRFEFEFEGIIHDTSTLPIKDSDGNIIAGMSMSQDITERKKAEQKLKESEEKYKNERDNFFNILNSMEDGVYIVNQQYNIEYINPVLIKEFGPFEGKKCFKYFNDREEVCPWCKNTDVFKGKTVRWEWNFFKNQKTYDLIDSPIKNPDGHISKLAIFRDITELKKTEEKLKELNKLKDDLMRRVSHELKTPLIPIKGFSDLLLTLHYNEFNSETISYLKEINHGCLRLEYLIADILKSSKLDSEQIKLNFLIENLGFLIRYNVKELNSLLRMRNQTISLRISDNLLVKCEKEIIYDIINNLLTNSIKYSPPNSEIIVQSEIKDHSIVISVKDNGIGFTEEEKRNIFKQFGKIEHYGKSRNIDTAGTGLGLYIAKKSVELHGGKIWMESEGRDKGSTFYFLLPLVS